MSFTEAPPAPSPKPTKTGITCSLRSSKRGVVFKLILNAAVQERVFGCSIDGKTVKVLIGRGADEGRLQVYLDEDAKFTAKKSMHGSAAITMGAWDLFPKDSRPAASGGLKNMEYGKGLLIDLPSWARPSGCDGRMAVEHGLKPIPKRNA